MWLERLLDLIGRTRGHLAFRNGERFGVDFLFEALAERQASAWVYLTPPDGTDPVSQGNALSSAVNRALDSAFLPRGMPYGYQVKLLESHLGALELRYLLVSRASFAPGLAQALCRLPAEHCRVLIEGGHPFDGASSIPQEQLALTPGEAEGLARTLEPSAVRTLWTVTQGAYADFLVGLARLRGEEAPALPTPTAQQRPADEEALVEPGVLLSVLLRQERYLEALDVACAHLPQRVAEFIARAGPCYQEQGLSERLFLNLRSLDDAYLQHEDTLEWLLVAAAATGRSASVEGLVSAYLSRHPQAYRLRARRVGLEPDAARRQQEARFLASAQPSSLTLFQWGSICPDPLEALPVLRESVHLAESSGRTYDAIRNAGALGRRLLHAGRYAEAASWTEWALRQYDRHRLADGYRRLSIQNDHAYARLMLGQRANLRGELREAQRHLEGVMPELAALFRSTLSEVELVCGNLAEALELARATLWEAPRAFIGKYVVPLVRVLVEAGRLEEAEQEALLARDLSQGETFEGGARLAVGIVGALRGDAADDLASIMNSPTEPAERRCAAAMYHLLASGRPPDALPEGVRSLFKDLSRDGLYLLSGPEALFHPIWAQFLAEDAPLRIRALGRPAVTLDGQPLELSPTLLELLTILALYPEGLTLGALETRYYKEGRGKRVNLKVNLSRLRKFVPISTSPYRIAIGYRLDALACEAMLLAGRLREGLSLYSGPLSPTSEAPVLEEWREHLDELVRQAALASSDPEALLEVARRSDDLDVWEKTLSVLSELHDPRQVLARATVTRLRKDYAS